MQYSPYQRARSNLLQRRSLALFLSAIAVIYDLMVLNATPPGDPICGAPSSLERVLAAREQMVLETKAKLQSIRPLLGNSPPKLLIERPSEYNLLRLILEGESGKTYQLETLGNLASGQWRPWLSVTLGSQPLSWSDDLMGNSPMQFYRLHSEKLDTVISPASNFRLLDHLGVARDLYYHTHLDAIAVLAAGTDLEQVAPALPFLNDLALGYTNKLQIWILLSDPAPMRSNVVAQTKRLGIHFPVLFDSDSLAARSVGLTRAGEVALVQPPGYMVVYRGEIASSSQQTAAQSFLDQALANLHSPHLPAVLRTPGNGPGLPNLEKEIPQYSQDVALVLHRHCAPCHRPNGVAPFALTNFSVAELWAPHIKHALLSGKMPPWHADPEYGRFSNDISLPGRLKSALIQWIDAGAPRGSGPDPLAELPPPPAYDQWPSELGEPDALVTVPLQSVKADGVEAYRYIHVQTSNPTNVWLRAAIVRPSNYLAAHHYLVWPGRHTNFQPTHLAEFLPGYKPFQLPPDTYVPLGKSNWLTFQLHYTTYGVATTDQPALALWYHKIKPPKQYISTSINNGTFVIPPQVRDHPVQAQWTTSRQITLYRLNPHMHVRGKRMQYEVFYPDGRRELLLSVPDYDFNWQIGYELAEPKIVPAGSRILVSGAFDNSLQNLANPDPDATVRVGEQSWEEMFMGFLDYAQ